MNIQNHIPKQATAHNSMLIFKASDIHQLRGQRFTKYKYLIVALDTLTPTQADEVLLLLAPIRDHLPTLVLLNRSHTRPFTPAWNAFLTTHYQEYYL